MTKEQNIYIQVLLENKKEVLIKALDLERKCKENVIKNPELYHNPANEITDSNKWIKLYEDELNMIENINNELIKKIRS